MVLGEPPSSGLSWPRLSETLIFGSISAMARNDPYVRLRDPVLLGKGVFVSLFSIRTYAPINCPLAEIVDWPNWDCQGSISGIDFGSAGREWF